MQGYIYFIEQDSDPKFIKIGYTTDLKIRTRQLQTGNPHKLNFLAIIYGNKEDEAEIHRKFQRLRQEGEWFTSDIEIYQYISLLEDVKDLFLEQGTKTLVKETVFSRNLSKFIKEKRVTLRRVSREAGVPIATLSGWIHGKTPGNFDAVYNIAQYLNVSLSKLLVDKEENIAPKDRKSTTLVSTIYLY